MKKSEKLTVTALSIRLRIDRVEHEAMQGRAALAEIARKDEIAARRAATEAVAAAAVERAESMAKVRAACAKLVREAETARDKAIVEARRQILDDHKKQIAEIESGATDAREGVDQAFKAKSAPAEQALETALATIDHDRTEGMREIDAALQEELSPLRTELKALEAPIAAPVEAAS